MSTPTPPPPATAESPSTPAAPDAPAASTTGKPNPVGNRPMPGRLPPFKVILHNDDVNEMVFVLRTLLELTPLGLEGSKRVMLDAHEKGAALVLVTHKERAELYREQFASKSMTVTIEPDA